MENYKFEQVSPAIDLDIITKLVDAAVKSKTIELEHSVADLINKIANPRYMVGEQ